MPPSTRNTSPDSSSFYRDISMAYSPPGTPLLKPHALPFALASPLLKSEVQSNPQMQWNQQPNERRRSCLYQWATSLHIILIFTYTFMFGSALLLVQSKAKCDCVGNKLVSSPADSFIEYTQGIYTDNHRTPRPFFGPPDEELDLAWHNLLRNNDFRISRSELAGLGDVMLEEGVQIPGDRDGYISTMYAFHELHCIKKLHQSIYPEYYFPNFTEQQHRFRRHHDEHCLDLLRQSAQCHGDPTLIPFRWGHSQPIPLTNLNAPHKCVNWDKLQDWAEERRVDPLKKGWLVHPTLGLPSFPNGLGDPTGVVEDD
ncbi:hypothetical protein K402DRAFT_463381 [Aulographum hederae CBS 113979]|uniref:Tat pathway signal sequence n=1 Tax=Aulographum hederae CBS 113979 TaxID=1176131 RepID=A0A6G1H0X0_9PEZI|nr:hypothetical protein K402DRAFT_463381 [Aulographum hederae CBS 113979]